MTIPLLLPVQHALPPRIQAIPHVAQLINDFVLPSTIDAAVYNDLQRVLSEFEEFRPYTVGAMDGAAANGRLDIVQRLHYNRDEGCSSAAFVGAASNGHLDVLEWLYQFYPELRRGLQELTEATTQGHVDVVEFLLGNWHLQGSELNRLLVTAAANGHVPVVRVFLRVAFDVHGALAAAAANDHVAVMQFLLDSGDICVTRALEKALECGHIGAIELLVRTGESCNVEIAFRNVVAAISADTMRAVLERCQFSEALIGSVLVAAAKDKKTDLDEVLAGKCPPMETSGTRKVWGAMRFTHPIQVAVTRAMIYAADAGHLEVLRILTKTSASFAGEALNYAVAKGQREVQTLLLELIEEKYLRNPRMAPVIRIMRNKPQQMTTWEFCNNVLPSVATSTLETLWGQPSGTTVSGWPVFLSRKANVIALRRLCTMPPPCKTPTWCKYCLTTRITRRSRTSYERQYHRDTWRYRRCC